MSRFDARHIQARGQVIIHERAVEQLPVFVVGEPLVKRIANALRHAAMDLPIEDQQIDNHPPSPTGCFAKDGAGGKLIQIKRFCGKLRTLIKQVRLNIRAFPFPASQRLEQEHTHGKEDFPMRKYELMCIIQPDLDETAFNGVLDKVKSWISESGGSVDKAEVWGRRKLAYIIQKHREGQYVLLNVSMEPAATSALERNLRFQESIIRHMLSVVG